jgi:hypothetical protein
MIRTVLWLLPLVVVGVLVLSGALYQQGPATDHAVAPPAPTTTDPQALAYLDRAAAALAPERAPCLEATVWQQARCDDFIYQASGRLLTASGGRTRLDMNVRVGRTGGELRVVCDGQALRRTIRVGDEAPTVLLSKLPTTRDGFATPEALAAARSDFLQQQAFAGLAPLLTSLRKGLQTAQAQSGTWNGKEVVVVSGRWPEDRATLAALPDLYKPRFKQRLCCIYLDAHSLWPYRLEWWGAEKPEQPNGLLVQVEFREPVFHGAVAAEQFVVD